jgi:sugar/nucleoside kinase (ribokinase family)
LFFGEDEIFFAPALPLEEVCDPTGAGDSFAGGLMGYLASRPTLNTEAIKQGILCGSAMASCTVEAFGTSSLEAVTEAVLQDRLRAFDRMTRIG